MIEFLLLFAMIGNNTENEFRKITLNIHYDEREPVEKLLYLSLNEDWKINPEVLKSFSEEDKIKSLEYTKTLTERATNIKECFDIKFHDRYKSGYEFGFKIGNGEHYKFPNEGIMCETESWLDLFEYLCEDYKYDYVHKRWIEKCDVIDSRNFIIKYEYNKHFCKKFVNENRNWHIVKNAEDHVFRLDDDTYSNESVYYSAEQLDGYLSPKLLSYPAKPPKPICKIKSFKFSFKKNREEQ